MKTKRLTSAQAIIQFLMHQHVERDSLRQRFFAGCLGIFGHGCIAAIGQALQQYPEFRYYMTKNEQASVHIATAFAKMSNRLRTFACVSSIGPAAVKRACQPGSTTVVALASAMIAGPSILSPGRSSSRRNTGVR